MVCDGDGDGVVRECACACARGCVCLGESVRVLVLGQSVKKGVPRQCAV